MTTSIKKRFRVYEVEHQGDEQEAISELLRVGCVSVKVIERDYNGEESIAVECVVPEGVKLSEAEVCL
jgi:hypothetical protein